MFLFYLSTVFKLDNMYYLLYTHNFLSTCKDVDTLTLPPPK